MPLRLPIRASLAFEAVAQGARFRDRVVRLVHFIMQRKQLLGIVSRAERYIARPIETVIPPHGKQDRESRHLLSTRRGRSDCQSSSRQSRSDRCLVRVITLGQVRGGAVLKGVTRPRALAPNAETM